MTNTGILADTPSSEKTNYNRVLRRPSPPLHLVGGVLLGRAYRGCNGEAREREKVEEHLPRPAFECRVNGIKLVGVNGGEDVRVAGVVGEGGLGVGNGARTSTARA